MDLFNLNYDEFEKLILVFARVGAILLFAPILGSNNIPAKLRIGFTLILSFLITPIVSPSEIPNIKGILSLAIFMLSEFTIGILIAYAVKLIFITVQIAGTVVDFQMGFGVVNVIDPQTESQVSITAQYMNVLAILFFLVLDGHHIIIQAIVESFKMINPHRFNFSGLTMQYLLNLFSGAFITAVKFAAPMVATLFFISVALGLIARTVPQMNVFIVGFPLQIGMGLLVLWFSLSFFAMLFKKQIFNLPENIIGLMHTV